MINKVGKIIQQVNLALWNEIKIYGLDKEAVERGFTPLRKSTIIEAYASNGYTESSWRKKWFKKSDSA